MTQDDAYNLGYALAWEMAWEKVGMDRDEFFSILDEEIENALRSHPLERELIDVILAKNQETAFHAGIHDGINAMMDWYKAPKITKPPRM